MGRSHTGKGKAEEENDNQAQEREKVKRENGHIPTWASLRELAEGLEFHFQDDTRNDDADGVLISKFGGVEGWFQDSEAGRKAALEWLQHQRNVWEQAEQYQRNRDRQ